MVSATPMQSLSRNSSALPAAVRAATPVRKAGAETKRKMSAEGRRRTAEATRKRWEAYRAEKAAAAH